MTDLNHRSASEIARMIRAGRTTPSAVMAAHLDRIAAREGAVGAFIHLDADRAMARAKSADRQRPDGPLHGVPFAIKDIIDTDDMPTGWGSDVFSDRWPDRNAPCVQAFLDAGAIPLGKTVTTEFAYFHPGKTANPHNFRHTPGGSSSGSAAAVADHMAPIAFGSQTAASLIRPAAYCGVCAFKPTTGAFDLTGVLSLAPSLDTLGLLSRDPEDFVLTWAVLTGSALPEAADFSDTMPRICMMRGPHWWEGSMEMRDTVSRALRILSDHGAETGEIAHPALFAELTAAQKVVMGFEAARVHAGMCASHGQRISEQFAHLIQSGLKVTETQYDAALAVRDQANAMVDILFADCDALLASSASGEAPEGLDATGDPLFSRMWNLLQLPCVALPLGTGPRGLPLGIQLIGRKNEDGKLLAVAKWVHGIFSAAS